MNSERQIVSKLYESNKVTKNETNEVDKDTGMNVFPSGHFNKYRKDLDETEFTYKGNTYKTFFGKYTKNGKPISKEDYHKARQELLSSDDSPGTLDYMLSLPSKASAKKIDSFHEFIDSLEYDKSYKAPKEVRDHLPKIDKDDTIKRVSQISRDTKMNPQECLRVNQLISNYTSTNPSKILGKDKELLDRYIDDSPVYKGIPIYRGMGFDVGTEEGKNNYLKIASLEPGDKFDFMGYTSFSSNPDVALNFAEANDGHNPRHVLMVNTKNLTGVSIDHLASSGYDEDELIYKKEVNIIVKKKIRKGDTLYLHVEEILMNEVDTDDNVLTLPTEGSMCLDKIEDKRES